MLSWALTFLIVALVAGLIGFSGVTGAAVNIAWILFVVGLVLAVIFSGGTVTAGMTNRPPVSAWTVTGSIAVQVVFPAGRSRWTTG